MTRCRVCPDYRAGSGYKSGTFGRPSQVFRLDHLGDVLPGPPDRRPPVVSLFDVRGDVSLRPLDP